MFSKQLLDVDNSKIPVDSLFGYITFPTNSCHFTESKIIIMQWHPTCGEEINK